MLKWIGYLGVAMVTGQLFADETTPFTPDAAVAYKQTEKGALQLHFFLPEGHAKHDGKRRAAIVFFFGGGWNGGSPAQFYPFARHLADKGMVAVSAQYRTKSSHGVDPRACTKDGKSAIRWLRAHAAEYGIDPERIAAGGGSAGGQVAAATGTATAFEEADEDTRISSWPNLLVLFNPVLDNGEGGYGHERVKAYWQQFSPLHNVTAKTPASIFFLGSKDNLIPLSTGQAWDAAIKAQGQASELHVWEGAGHGFFNYAKEGGRYYHEILPKLDAFLKQQGYFKIRVE